MMGIYTAVMVGIYMTTGIPMIDIPGGLGLVDALSKVVPFAAIGVAVTSLYSAVSNIGFGSDDRTHSPIHGREGMMRSGRITQAPVVAMPIVMREQAAQQSTQASRDVPAHAEGAPTNNWANRADIPNRQNRIQEILANGSLSDKGRAEALEQARNQQQTMPAGRA